MKKKSNKTNLLKLDYDQSEHQEEKIAISTDDLFKLGRAKYGVNSDGFSLGAFKFCC